MQFTKKSLLKVAIVTMLALLATSTLASDQNSSCMKPRLMTAHEMSEMWLGAFNTFLSEKNELSEEKAGIIMRAVELAEASNFKAFVSTDAREALAEIVAEIDSKFTREEYIEIFYGMREMQPWLLQSDIVNIPVCTCAGYCSVGSCQSGCYSVPGEWGYCNVTVFF